MMEMTTKTIKSIIGMVGSETITVPSVLTEVEAAPHPSDDQVAPTSNAEVPADLVKPESAPIIHEKPDLSVFVVEDIKPEVKRKTRTRKPKDNESGHDTSDVEKPKRTKRRPAVKKVAR